MFLVAVISESTSALSSYVLGTASTVYGCHASSGGYVQGMGGRRYLRRTLYLAEGCQEMSQPRHISRDFTTQVAVDEGHLANSTPTFFAPA